MRKNKVEWAQIGNIWAKWIKTYTNAEMFAKLLK